MERAKLSKDERDIGKIVKHFKREECDLVANPLAYVYRIVGFARDCETMEKKVVYQALADSKMWLRGVEEFYSKVDKQKYPNIKQEDRFEILV